MWKHSGFFLILLWSLVVNLCDTLVVEALAVSKSINLQSSFSSPSLSSSPTASSLDPNILPIRTIRFQNLGRNSVLRYQSFTPFGVSWRIAFYLTIFWSEIATQVSNIAWMPEDQFLSHAFKLHMRLGQENDLVFEVINFEGLVTRKLVAEIAGAMMEYCMRGFCGVFNAWMGDRGHWGVAKGVWIVLRVAET